MIAQIKGKILQQTDNSILVETAGFAYRVLIPTTTMSRINENISPDGMICLETYHYFQVEPSKSTPVLIGFLNDVERDFFEKFITVSGIGPRAAVKALNKPISLIAKAIDEADLDFLKTLPGIGQQRAREIIAKLQGKVGKYALIQDSDKKVTKDKGMKDFEEEALEVLVQLQYKRHEAKEMIQKALSRCESLGTVEDLLNEVYRQRKKI